MNKGISIDRCNSVSTPGLSESSDCPACAPMKDRRNADGEKRCRNCRRTLTLDEVALHKKLFNRAADSFLCIFCSAEYFGVTTPLLEEKIRQFKEMGCTLFE